MIGSCDICDRQSVPVRFFSVEESSARCETTACYLCQGETDPDPYDELDGAVAPSSQDRGIEV